MSNKKASCKVLGVANGPCCEVCRAPMDTILVESPNHPLCGKEGHYCYFCTRNELPK